MKLVAIGMVKDEEDVIERVLWNVARQGADLIVLYDNLSEDRTPAILRKLDGHVGPALLEVYTDWEQGYYQSRKMTELAAYALKRYPDEAVWVWPFDADEVWSYAAGTVRDALEEQPTSVGLVGAMVFNRYETALDSDEDDHPFDRMIWRPERSLGLPKVIARGVPGLVIAQGNHSAWVATEAGRARAFAEPTVILRVDHFPYRGADHFVRKARNGARAYAATDLSEDEGRHWREYGAALEEHGEEALKAHYRAHFYYPDPEGAGLIRDPAGVPPTYDPSS